MVTLATGAAGFVGSAVVRRLLASGREVRVLVRSGSDRRNLEGLDVEQVAGNLGDPARRALARGGRVAAAHAQPPAGPARSAFTIAAHSSRVGPSATGR